MKNVVNSKLHSVLSFLSTGDNSRGRNLYEMKQQTLGYLCAHTHAYACTVAGVLVSKWKFQ